MVSKGKTTLISAMALLFVMGCATERGATTSGKQPPPTNTERGVVAASSKQLPPTNPDEVTIYLADKKPPFPYETIGRVSADRHSVVGLDRPRDEIYKDLREKAASIGGDAVINITEFSGSLSGVVVKLTPRKK